MNALDLVEERGQLKQQLKKLATASNSRFGKDTMLWDVMSDKQERIKVIEDKLRKIII